MTANAGSLLEAGKTQDDRLGGHNGLVLKVSYTVV